jgi:hypothetical protein
MIPDEARDPILFGLGRLGTLTPNPTRSERVRARCHSMLKLRHQRAARGARRLDVARRVIEPALVGGFCLIYLSAMVYDVLRLQGLR